MSIEFGDSEPDDAYATEADPDPYHVAERLHDLRWILDPIQLPHWVQLTDEEREVGVGLMVILIGYVVTHWAHPLDLDEEAAEYLHDARRDLDRLLPRWEELPPDQQAVAIYLVREILRWLVREGTLR